ncbi:hypothetical protein B0H16DRAFT_1840146 [Mycena metata]|uniref:Uncharacterized protein n=1 Tax=Mycena metata TaxID=1033252 RepID=A0AAD7N8W5_9AGAR|nr:hypothetical protein B0H16DRAFT_1840146 [Mycena metata]
MPKIPRPRWSHAQIRNKPLVELSDTMGWSEREFGRFKEHIIAAANKLNLDTFSEPKDQDPAKWEQLLVDCRAKFPQLDDFHNHWPLEVYYTKYVAWRVSNRNRRCRSTQGTGTRSQGKSKKNNKYVGSEKEQRTSTPTVIQSSVNLARRARTHANPRSPAPGEESPSASRSSKSISVAQTSLDASPSVSGNNQGSSSGSKAGSVAAKDNSSLSVTSTASRGTGAVSSQKAKRGPCILCGAQFPVSPSETVQLRECFHDRLDLLRVLSVVGVIADHHLNAFLRLNSHRRHDFLHSGALQGRLTYLQKVEILDLLESYHDSRSSASTSRLNPDRAQTVGSTKIKRPSAGLEDILAYYRAGYTDVMRHMRVTDEEEYLEVVDLIEGQSPQYLDVANPIEDQDDAQLEALVEAICEEKPHLRTYDDLWPVYVHIRRYLSARSAGLPGTRSAPTAPALHKCPLLQTHPHSRVPRSLAALLEDLDMEELGPAFLLLGIRSDDQLASIITSPRVKAQFVAELSTGAGRSLVGCSEFQRTMMAWVLEQV